MDNDGFYHRLFVGEDVVCDLLKNEEVTYRICAAAHPASHRGGALGR